MPHDQIVSDKCLPLSLQSDITYNFLKILYKILYNAFTPSANLPLGFQLSPNDSCIKPRLMKAYEERVLEDDGLEDVSNDELLEEICIAEKMNESQSFLGRGPTNLSKF